MCVKELEMRLVLWCLPALTLAALIPGLSAAGQDCPARPSSGSVVQNPFSLSSVNGTLTATLSMAHSVDNLGYTHYCYKYNSGGQIVEAPTLRLNPGDKLNLHVVNNIVDSNASRMKMKPSAERGQICGDTGAETIDSTNVHFHGLNVPPVCHQDDVIN